MRPSGLASGHLGNTLWYSSNMTRNLGVTSITITGASFKSGTPVLVSQPSVLHPRYDDPPVAYIKPDNLPLKPKEGWQSLYKCKGCGTVITHAETAEYPRQVPGLMKGAGPWRCDALHLCREAFGYNRYCEAEFIGFDVFIPPTDHGR